MLGYQLFLFYGPGLTALVGLARLLSFGQLSDPGALEVVLVAAYLAMPLATARLGRAFGLRRSTAVACGVLALAAGSTRGGGIDGAFATGLAAQQVAVPLTILALAQLVERVNLRATDRRTGVLPLAATVAAIALTHPLSLIVLALFGPVCLAAVWLAGSFDRSSWRTVVVAAAWTVGLSAWWWLPALAGLDLRGPVTSFTLPGVWEHVELLVNGDRGWRGIAGPVATLGVVAAIADGLVSRDRQVLAVAVLPVAAFGVLHGIHGLLGITDDVGRQLPNRGLVFVAVLMAPAAALTVESWLQAVPTSVRSRVSAGTWVIATWAVLGAVTAWAVTHLEIGPVDQYHPIDAMHEAAAILEDEVPEGARFAWVDGNSNGMGVPEPQRWLAWKSNRPSTTPFGPEYAPGSASTQVASQGPGDGDVDAWIDAVRQLGVTHIATADDEVTAVRLEGNPRLDQRLARDFLFVWRIEPAPSKPVGSIIPALEAEVVEADVNRYVIDVGRPDDEAVEIALGYSPGWEARIDGREVEVRRSAGDRVEIDLPAGDHRVELSFVEPLAGPAGRSVSVATALGAVVWWWRQRRRSTRSDPVAETGSKSPATARR